MSVTQTIAQQAKAQGVKAKKLVKMDERTLRFHQKRGGFVFNTDVAYDRARDLYNITVHKLDMRLEVGGEFNANYGDLLATKTYQGAFCDQLGDLIGRL
jgi:hypothetical protein